MYLLGSAMFLIFAIVWQIFGSSEVQPWDYYGEVGKYNQMDSNIDNIEYRNIDSNGETDEETILNDDDFQ